MTEMTTTIKVIESKMAEEINRVCGTSVDVTNRGPELYTVSGSESDVNRAVKFLHTTGIMVETNREHDEELNETFSYLRCR